MLWDELLKEVILHNSPLCSLLHILIKDGECVCRTSENCKSLVLQDKCNIEIFVSPESTMKPCGKLKTCNSGLHTTMASEKLKICF